MNLIKSNYALEQGYTILDLSNKFCKRCLTTVYHEKHLVITDNEYPYYCAECDENMYSFEVSKLEQTTMVIRKGQDYSGTVLATPIIFED